MKKIIVFYFLSAALSVVASPNELANSLLVKAIRNVDVRGVIDALKKNADPNMHISAEIYPDDFISSYSRPIRWTASPISAILEGHPHHAKAEYEDRCRIALLLRDRGARLDRPIGFNSETGRELLQRYCAPYMARRKGN